MQMSAGIVSIRETGARDGALVIDAALFARARGRWLVPVEFFPDTARRRKKIGPRPSSDRVSFDRFANRVGPEPQTR